MNLVGFGLTVHDSSVAAYKNGKFLYRKAERQFKSKHAHGDMHWAKSVLDEWDIDDFELSVSTWLSGNNSQDFIRAVDGVVYIDHHYSHQLSSSVRSNTASNTLDDYEEGSFTPTYAPETGSFTTLTLVGATPVSHGQLR